MTTIRATSMTDEAFEQLALGDPDGRWELWDGVSRRKPGMTFQHNDLAFELGHALRLQLDRARFRVRVDAGHVRRPRKSYFIPDVFVIPAATFAPLIDDWEHLEAYTDPLPLVGEVLSRTTRRYNLGLKLEEYRNRGDLEIWLIDPRRRTLTAWRRQPDGTYTETVQTGGVVRPVALPGVAIDLDALFAL